MAFGFVLFYRGRDRAHFTVNLRMRLATSTCTWCVCVGGGGGGVSLFPDLSRIGVNLVAIGTCMFASVYGFLGHQFKGINHAMTHPCSMIHLACTCI